jgi:hypothetical protein
MSRESEVRQASPWNEPHVWESDKKSKRLCRLGQEILALCLGFSVRSVELPLPCFANRLRSRGLVVSETYVRVLRCVKFKSSLLVHPSLCVRYFPSPQLSVHESCLWRNAEKRIRIRRTRTRRGMYIAHQLQFCGIARAAYSQALEALTACMQVCSSVVEDHHDSTVFNHWTRDIRQCLHLA